jgi:hypothetical protein
MYLSATTGPSTSLPLHSKSSDATSCSASGCAQQSSRAGTAAAGAAPGAAPGAPKLDCAESDVNALHTSIMPLPLSLPLSVRGTLVLEPRFCRGGWARARVGVSVGVGSVLHGWVGRRCYRRRRRRPACRVRRRAQRRRRRARAGRARAPWPRRGRPAHPHRPPPRPGGPGHAQDPNRGARALRFPRRRGAQRPRPPAQGPTRAASGGAGRRYDPPPADPAPRGPAPTGAGPRRQQTRAAPGPPAPLAGAPAARRAVSRLPGPGHRDRALMAGRPARAAHLLAARGPALVGRRLGGVLQRKARYAVHAGRPGARAGARGRGTGAREASPRGSRWRGGRGFRGVGKVVFGRVESCVWWRGRVRARFWGARRSRCVSRVQCDRGGPAPRGHRGAPRPRGVLAPPIRLLTAPTAGPARSRPRAAGPASPQVRRARAPPSHARAGGCPAAP